MLSILFETLASDDMQDKAYRICYGFYWSIKKWLKLGQKADFLAHFRTFLFITPHTLWVTPHDFAKWNTLLRYISEVTLVVVKSKIFKVVCIDSASMKWPLLWGFGHLLHKILFNLTEILNKGSLLIRQMQCLKTPSKFWILAQRERTQSLQF